jgi:hypothetical protein
MQLKLIFDALDIVNFTILQNLLTRRIWFTVELLFPALNLS